MGRSFSQRKGVKPVKDVIQIDFVDNDLRNSLWTALTLHYWSKAKVESLQHNPDLHLLCQALWHSYFKQPIDALPNSWSNALYRIRQYFFGCKWYEIYDFIEFMANNHVLGYEIINSKFKETCNGVLKKEISAYRFIDDFIVEITSKEEIAEIEQAINDHVSTKSVNFHLKRALELLADRDSPDYRNSIKESISSVEAMCNLVAGNSSTTLAQALKELDKTQDVMIHPALSGAFGKLYGYTSDSNGIRHALLEESNLDFEDSKFMLVSCSAFINYLRSKAAKANISL